MPVLLLLGFAISVLGIGGCGGDVHFVTPAVSTPAGEIPPEPTGRKVRPILTEKFNFARPSGTVIVPFVFYGAGSATMVEAVEKHIDLFLREFWGQEGGSLSDVRFAIAIDRADPWIRWFAPAAEATPRPNWRASSRNFFTRELEGGKKEFKKMVGASEEPFYSTFAEIASAAKATLDVTRGPAWVRFAYFRDYSLLLAPAMDSGLQAAKAGLDLMLQTLPLAASRKTFSSFTYADRGSTCRPLDSETGDFLRADFAAFPRSTAAELCRLSAADLLAVATQAVADARRLVLAKIPRSETVIVRIVNGAMKTDVAKDQIVFVSPTEFRLGALAAAQAAGKEVEIDYEPIE